MLVVFGEEEPESSTLDDDQVPSSRNASGATYVAFREASIKCALPIHDREAAGIATETRCPEAWRVSTKGRMYGHNRRDGGPSSLTTYGRNVSISSLCLVRPRKGIYQDMHGLRSDLGVYRNSIVPCNCP